MTEWKEIPNHAGYFASTDGSVRSHKGKAPRILKQCRGSHGYLMVSLCLSNGKRVSMCVHSVIALTFIGERPNGLDVCHNDGNKDNNQWTNLRYDTRQNNIDDQRKHGTFKWHGKVKLSSDQIKEVVAMLHQGKTHQSIGDVFGVSRGLIQKIAVGKWRGDISGIDANKAARGPLRGTKARKLTKETVLQIVERLDSGDKQKFIANDFNVKPQTVNQINTGKIWDWLTGRSILKVE